MSFIVQWTVMGNYLGFQHTGTRYLPEMFETGLWIRIRIGSGFSDFVDPDPNWESGSRIRIQGQEN
jgi:hypothetical protein